jgi:ADP-ribose pyrophosphatase YjhB (NUDIX family)
MNEALNKIGDPTMCPVVAIIRDGKFITGMRNYTPDKWKTISVWTVPGGRCDAGETLETTLRREVGEEIGITDLQITDFLGIVPGSKEGDIVYLFAGKTEREPKNMEPHKFSEWIWSEPEKVADNFINAEVLKIVSSFIKGRS